MCASGPTAPPSEEERERAEEDAKLPFQKASVQIQIAQDIKDDRQAMKELLAEQDARGPEGVKDMLVRRATMARRVTAARKLGKDAEALEEKEVPEMRPQMQGMRSHPAPQ